MNAFWTAIPAAQQNLFLQAAGLNQLPEPQALSETQKSILAGIVGAETVATSLQAAAPQGSLQAPQLPPPAIGGDWSAIMAIVAEVRMKINEMQVRTSVEEIKQQKTQMKDAHEKEMAKLKESIAKLEEANKTSFWSKFLGIFAKIAGIVAAVAVTVATGGAAWPTLAIAVGFIVAEETGLLNKAVEFMADHLDIMSTFCPIALVLNILKRNGVISDEMVKTCLSATVAIALAVAGGFAGGAIASRIAAKAGEIAGEVGAKAGATAAKLANVGRIVNFAGQGAASLASVGAGITTIAEASYRYQSEQAQADAKDVQAWLAKLTQMLEEESEHLQELINRINQDAAQISEVFHDMAKSQQRVIANMGM